MTGASHCPVESLCSHGHHQVIKCAFFESPSRMIGAARNHDAQRTRVRRHRAQEVEAGHVRQFRIQEHDVRVERARRVNSRPAAGGLADHLYIVPAFTQPDQAISRMGLVLDYQYFHVRLSKRGYHGVSPARR